MELHERLAQLRQEHNYRLRDLRDAIENATGELMALSYLSTLEKETKAPSIDALTKIAAGYNMTLRDLLSPVELPGTPQRQYSQAFIEFADELHLSEPEREALYQVEYRGKRPETKEGWGLLYSAFKTIENRGV